ncbi:MAG: DMT family transporter [Desulfitobacteriaceae bacterium]|nr:DMT family transporter [Desulfitobacteriaceae bacterium]MDI6878649.1 DMT family transporter [Desulfitobacteriaceae bacterium]MDI6914347.1 DMT family transporter [Desulfitobacteriaceae bacterium]
MQTNEAQIARKRRMGAYLALVLMSMLYSGNLISARILAPQVPPIALSAYRGILGLLVLLPLAWRTMKASPKPNRRDWFMLSLLGFLGITVAYGSFLWGMQYTSASNAAIIFATNPAVTNGLLVLFWGVKPTRIQLLGIFSAFIGLVVVISQGSISRLLGFHLSASDLVLLINVLAIALFTNLSQGVMAKFSPVVTTVYTLVFGTLFLLPYGVWETTQRGWHLTWQGWLIFFYMGFIVTGFALFLNFAAIDGIGSGQAAVFGNLAPVFSMILAVFVLGEHLYTYHWLGFALVVGGILLSISKDFRNSPDPPKVNGGGRNKTGEVRDT